MGDASPQQPPVHIQANAALHRSGWNANKHDVLLVVATLITALSYQLGTNIPGGYWQDDNAGHLAGDPIMRDKHRRRYWLFMAASWTGFGSSMLMTLCLLTRVPVASRRIRWPFVVAYSSLVLTFITSQPRTSLLMDIGIWVGVLVILYLGTKLCHRDNLCCLKSYQKIEFWHKFLRQMSYSEKHDMEKKKQASPEALQANANGGWSDNDHDVLLVIATLITALSYQLGTNIPGGFWQDDNAGHIAGDPIMRDKHRKRYWLFMAGSWTGFGSSMLMTLCLLTKVPVESRRVRLSFVVSYSSLVLTFVTSQPRTSLLMDIGIWVGVLVFLYVGSKHCHKTRLCCITCQKYSLVMKPTRAIYESFELERIEIRAFAVHNSKEMSECAKQCCGEISIKIDGDSPAKRSRYTGWEGNDKNILLVVATLITTLLYQLGTNIPGGFWQADDSQNGYQAGDPVMRDKHKKRYWLFMSSSWIGFGSSMLLTLCLLTGVPANSRRIKSLFIVSYSSLVLSFITSQAGTFLVMDFGIWIGVLFFLWAVVKWSGLECWKHPKKFFKSLCNTNDCNSGNQ
ncbi:uncharacterized protein [Typha latifolia]|uniref:uncharacterized protein n=1 Tax=Typha latifolia TaxID=4733 RepID=UPI003C2F96D5